MKWNITPSTTLRASAGLGYRSTNVLTDNIGMLATGRASSSPELGDPGPSGAGADRGRQPDADLSGSSSPGDATLSFDYFRTQFFHAVVVDQEYDPETIRVYGSIGPSWTDTYQIDFSWSPVEPARPSLQRSATRTAR